MKKDVIILGIHDGHNAGAALTKNGSVAAAIQEDACTDSSPQYLQTLGLVSPFYHKTLVRELEV